MNPTSPVARFIAARILDIGKSQKDIAREVGFESANVITMIKQGATKLPARSGSVTGPAEAIRVRRKWSCEQGPGFLSFSV